MYNRTYIIKDDKIHKHSHIQIETTTIYSENRMLGELNFQQKLLNNF